MAGCRVLSFVGSRFSVWGFVQKGTLAIFSGLGSSFPSVGFGFLNSQAAGWRSCCDASLGHESFRIKDLVLIEHLEGSDPLKHKRGSHKKRLDTRVIVGVKQYNFEGLEVEWLCHFHEIGLRVGSQFISVRLQCSVQILSPVRIEGAALECRMPPPACGHRSHLCNRAAFVGVVVKP